MTITMEELKTWVRERHDMNVREATKAKDCANEAGQIFHSMQAVAMGDVFEKITGARIPVEEIKACHTQCPKFQCPHCEGRIDPKATRTVSDGVDLQIVCYGCHEQFEVKNFRAAFEKLGVAI